MTDHEKLEAERDALKAETKVLKDRNGELHRERNALRVLCGGEDPVEALKRRDEPWRQCPDAEVCQRCTCADEDDVCFPGERLRAELRQRDETIAHLRHDLHSATVGASEAKRARQDETARAEETIELDRQLQSQLRGELAWVSADRDSLLDLVQRLLDHGPGGNDSDFAHVAVHTGRGRSWLNLREEARARVVELRGPLANTEATCGTAGLPGTREHLAEQERLAEWEGSG